ncbi:TetR/AcrR family transcriptional regulator [Actinopolymorpha sp. B17G11]|uniref:TetR/AcrR family transcriptional regulator n=1 Tax=unclassified Actinopolymorpha TaxID=2627063 RepID=UPI0032D8CFFD
MAAPDRRAPQDYLGALELLWGLRQPSSLGPKRALSVRQIAEAGVAIADAQGLAAISMQRVAGELDYTKMALYRYVRSKAELLAVMTDLAIGDPPDLGPPEDGWRTRLERWARLIRATWNRHPWLPHVSEWQASPGAVRPVSNDRIMGPNEVAWVETATSTLSGLGMSPQEQLDAVFLVSAHLRATQAMTTYGLLPWTLGLPHEEMLDRLRGGHEQRFPTLSRLAASTHDPAHSAFEFGLARILDGLELLIDKRTR